MQESLFPEEDPKVLEANFLATVPARHLVVNRRVEQEEVYIGRGSFWGNPFRIGEHGSRMEVIEAYRRHLWDRIRKGEVMPHDLLALERKRLGCYCSPKPCHGHVLLQAIAWAKGAVENPKEINDNTQKFSHDA